MLINNIYPCWLLNQLLHIKSLLNIRWYYRVVTGNDI